MHADSGFMREHLTLRNEVKTLRPYRHSLSTNPLANVHNDTRLRQP